MMVYVKNNGQYKVTFSATKQTEVVDGAGRKSLVNTPVFTRSFGVLTKDPITGQVLHTGFTQIEEEEYEKLFSTSKHFQNAIKAGNLVKYDEAPKEALLDSQLLDNAYNEVAQLKEKVRQLESVIAAGGGKTTAKQIEELNAENETLKKELDDLKKSLKAPAQKDKNKEPEF